MTDQYPPPPGSVPPPDPTGNPASQPPPLQQPPAYPPQPTYPPPADPYAPQGYGQPGYGQQEYGQQAYPPPGYPPPPGYQPPYGQPGYPPPHPGVNGFAIASLIFSILGGLLFSVTFGIIALVQIAKRGQRGRGLAIAGLSISGVWLLVIIGLFSYGFAQGINEAANTPDSTVAPTVEATTPTDEPSATPTEESTVTDDYVVGECLNDLSGDRTKASCATAHDGEVYAVYNLKNGKWPGEAAVKKQAEAGCNTRLDSYAKNPARWDFYYLYPDESFWPDDRSVICVAADPHDKKITGSIKK